MKKSILSLLLYLPIVLGSIITLNAQNINFIGVESSILSSGIENQNPYGIAKLPAINTPARAYSVLFGKNLKNGFSLSMEPTYTQLGQNYLDKRVDGDYQRKISLDYLQMPVMLSRVFGEGKIRIKTKAGLYGAYLLKSVFEESTVIPDGETIGARSIEENSDRFNKLDLGFKASLGSQITLSEKLALNLNYNVSTGFSDLNTEAYQYTPGYALTYKKSRNVSMGINLGFQIAF